MKVTVFLQPDGRQREIDCTAIAASAGKDGVE
jgi:hypothetical protein